MKILTLTQGSQEWLAHRATHFNASDAPAMMGCSPHKSRQQLVAELATGTRDDPNQSERSKFYEEKRFAEGHSFEALARPLAEQIVGEELFPVVGTSGQYSASFDGLTMLENVAFEHKRLNNDLRSVMPCVGVGNAADLPLHYRAQMEHQMMVAAPDCITVLFMATEWSSDGEGGWKNIDARHCWYASDPALREQIIAGWNQLEADVSAYVPGDVETKVKVIGRTPETLPELRIELDGSVTASNLPEYKAHAIEVFKNINRKLSSDQDFADAEKAAKWCEAVEERLEKAKESALEQTAGIAALFKTLTEISSEAKQTRIELEKLVKARKDQLRQEAIGEGEKALTEYIKNLNRQLGLDYIPDVPADFASAVKGKRTMETTRNAVSDELARAKIALQKLASEIRANIDFLGAQEKKHAFLFPDAKSLTLMDPQEFRKLVNDRIARQEESKAMDEAVKIADADEPAAEQSAIKSPPAEAVQAFSGAIEQAPQLPGVEQIDDGARITLGKLKERIAPVSIDASGLEKLGFKHESAVGPSKNYRESDVPKIIAAMIKHLSAL